MKQKNWTTSCTQNESERARETLIWLEGVTEKETGNVHPGACVDVLPRCCMYSFLRFLSICKELKVTRYLQGCLTCKWFSVFQLTCRNLKPYIKLKLSELLSYVIDQDLQKKLVLSTFYFFLMRAPESLFQSYNSKQFLIFINRLVNSFRSQSTCKLFNFYEKLQKKL